MAGILIVIVSYNSKRYMQECIESIRNTQHSISYKIIVVDNASTDGITQWLEVQPDIILLKNCKNVGFGPACNQAVSSTIGTKYENWDVFLLNNDTVINKNSIVNLAQALNTRSDIGAVGCLSNYAGNRQQLDISFNSVEEYVHFGENLNIPKADRYIEKVRLNGFAMLIRRNVWDEVGGFDEDFAPGYYEDDALSIEILKRGYRLLLTRDSFIYHVGSASFVKTGNNRLSYEHYELFKQKYKFDILKYVYPSGGVISQLPFNRDDHFNLLQIGCGLSAELKAIKSIFANSTVYGIEENEVLWNIASHTEKIYKNVSTATEALSSNTIDVLIVDSEYKERLSSDDITHIRNLCKNGALEITHYRQYDELDFQNIRAVQWSAEKKSEILLNTLYDHGIVCIKDDDRIISDKSNVIRIDDEMQPYIIANLGRLKPSDQGHINAHIYALLSSLDTVGEISFSSHVNCKAVIPDLMRLTEKNAIQINRFLDNAWNNCGYITASCPAGDCGIVGFYCDDQRKEQLLYSKAHFLFENTNIEEFIKNNAPISLEHIDSENIAVKILLKGPKSLKPIENYLIGGSITTEYSDDCSGDNLPTKLYDDKFNIICYSMLRDSFDENSIMNMFDELEGLAGGVLGHPMIILILGSEIKYEGSPDMSTFYKDMNEAILDFSVEHENFRLLNTTDYVKSSDDYKDNFNEFNVRVYSDMTEKICEFINEYVESYTK